LSSATLLISNLKKTFYAPDGSVSAHIELPYLKLDVGNALVLTGVSGCGKSTLLHMISGLLRPDEGSICFEGQELTKFSERQYDAWRREKLGYLFQNFNLLDGLTALENVILPGFFLGRRDNNLRRDGLERLRAVGLSAKAELYPAVLSLGEKQRVAAARAMFNHPRLLLADEPTASLDRANSLRLLELLQGLCSSEGTALLLTSHDPFVIQQFPLRYDVSSAGGVQ